MNDYELIYLAQEQNEDALEILYRKYENLINFLIHKKINLISQNYIDIADFYSVVLPAFSDSIKYFDANRNASFATFLSVVINNRINSCLKKYFSQKEQFFNSTLSLDLDYEDYTILDCIIDYKLDPWYNISDHENTIELLKKIKRVLSNFEYEIYTLLVQGFNYQQIARMLNKTPKQIDNAMQRIKNKLKLLLN